MNWIDYTIFTLVFFTAIFGLAGGPVIQFIRIICLFISFFAAFFFYPILGNVLKGVFTFPVANLLGYFIIFGTAFILTYVLSDLVKRALERWNIGIGLRLFGALLGIVKGLIFCGVIIYGVLLFCSKPTCNQVYQSRVAVPIGKGMHTITSLIPENTLKKIMNGNGEEGRKDKILPDTDSSRDVDFKSTLSNE
ncbi:MAG: CvpA family protein [wastewater metagenome]|nr:CvpA family protein [Candidatus Loosdrechtia aerotolerans]